MSSTASGISILVLAGITNASFTLPMKYARKWAWENIWLAWTLFALVILPIAAALLTVPHLVQVYRSSTPQILLEVCGFGAGWGIAQVFFGVAVDMIGIALTFSIVLGTSAALGSLIPLISLHRERLNSGAGYAVLGAVLVVLVGVSVCATAGRMRERVSARAGDSDTRASLGLLLAILCGVLASLMNFGVAFGTPLMERAQAYGASPLQATNAVWLPLMMAGAVPNVLYCAWLMKRNHSGDRFREGHSHWGLAFIMAIFWFGSTLLYGLSAVQLGPWGPILGWPLFMSLIVITASMLGMFTGEWKGSGRGPIRIQWAGVALLVVAVCILAGSSRYLQ
jgi:L-rhamnose-H+ transport protein